MSASSQASTAATASASLAIIPSPTAGPRLRWAGIELDALAFALEFQHATIHPSAICGIDDALTTLSGKLEGDLTFTLRWWAEGNLLRKQISIHGSPDASWGELLRLVVHEGPIPGENGDGVDASMGWREAAFEPGAAETRKPEEGAGRLPACGYPVFLQRFFAGLEHPMGFNEWLSVPARLRLYHHPRWQDEALTSQTMVLGLTAEGSTTEAAFRAYVATIRKPMPLRASVEINTFWTDPCRVNEKGEVVYDVDFPAYRAMAEGWINTVFNGETGLISSFVLDAGWQNPHSIYQPKGELGGPGDEGLAAFAGELEKLGLSLGLWISVNGPVGVSPTWAEEAGYSVSDTGLGAGYSASARTRFICLDDRRWVDDFCTRLDALNAAVPVAFYKGDWDNDGILSPAQQRYPLLETAWEENVNAMMRMYATIAPRRADGLPGSRVRGSWWLSPWWLPYVDCTHLSHSGDLEHCALPALTQRDAALNSRDMLMYEHLVLHRSPIPWDTLISHDFATAPRSPVYDSDESWLHNLLVWISRGGQAIQLYVPPYGMRGWRATVLRQLLRWFRDHEALLWKSDHAWIGGNPGQGEVYGYHHFSEAGELLLLRNPIGRPQPLASVVPKALRAQIAAGGWQTLYPYRGAGVLPEQIASNEVLLLQRSGSPLAAPAPVPTIPALHEIPAASLSLQSRSGEHEIWKLVIPYDYDAAELVLEYASPTGDAPNLRIAAGRYSDGLSSAALPVTWLTPFWQPSYTEKRSRIAPERWQRVIARAPLPVGGSCYLSIRSTNSERTGIWLEGLRHNEQETALSSNRALPLPPLHRSVLV